MGETNHKSWEVRIDVNGKVVFNPIAPRTDGKFLSAHCEKIVGVRKRPNDQSWHVTSPEDPDSEPWYLLRVTGSYPNKLIYREGEAYWVSDMKAIDIDGVILEYVNPEAKVVFDKEQLDQAVEQFHKDSVEIKKWPI